MPKSPSKPKIYKVEWPFLKQYDNIENRWARGLSWRPGVGNFNCNGEKGKLRASGVGHAVFTKLAEVELVGRYANRVLYTRHWEPPEGDDFGKPLVRMMARSAFTRMISGYRYTFEVDPHCGEINGGLSENFHLDMLHTQRELVRTPKQYIGFKPKIALKLASAGSQT